MNDPKWMVHNPAGNRRIVVTKNLPGRLWLDVLVEAGCRVEICQSEEVLSEGLIRQAIGTRCDGVIGQLTEKWEIPLFECLKAAGGKVYSNYAVGVDNIDLEAATRHGIAVGNTPGVLTEATAELAVALTFAAARRIGEAERFIRAGRFKGWLPKLYVGDLLWRGTLGIIGAGRIGSAYARMMVEGHKMDVLYYSRRPKRSLESHINAYGAFLDHQGIQPVTCRHVENLDELLAASDCVSIHTPLNPSTRHLIDADRLQQMKKNAVLINTSRGPIVDEAALVEHCRANPEFRIGLDVFESEPSIMPGLAELDNAVIVPHIGSATRWSRQGMAILAARNVTGVLHGYPLWNQSGVGCFLEKKAPKAVPSILNPEVLGDKG